MNFKLLRSRSFSVKGHFATLNFNVHCHTLELHRKNRKKRFFLNSWIVQRMLFYLGSSKLFFTSKLTDLHLSSSTFPMFLVHKLFKNNCLDIFILILRSSITIIKTYTCLYRFRSCYWGQSFVCRCQGSSAKWHYQIDIHAKAPVWSDIIK